MPNPTLFPIDPEPYEGDHYQVVGDGPYEVEGPEAPDVIFFRLQAANKKAAKLEREYEMRQNT